MDNIHEAASFCNSVKRDYGRFFSSLPSKISLRKNEKDVYFLRNTISGNSLYSVNVEGDDHSPKIVLDPDLNQQKLSRSEQLLRERMRASGSGITFYEYVPSCDSLLVNTGTRCCLIPCGQHDQTETVLFPCKEGAVDYKLCPGDSSMVGCVSDGDIWLLSPPFSNPIPLTLTTGERPARKLTAGQPSFILQEEFDRYTGYWWAPDSGKNGEFRILYEEVDETNVEVVKTFNPGTQELDTYSYPRPGSVNAVSVLKMLSFEISNEQVTKKIIRSLPQPIQDYLNNWEYIVRMGWTDDGENIWVLLMNRQQNMSQILLISSKVFEDNAIIPVILWEESSETWINCSNVEYLEFLPPSNENSTRLLITSEKTGFPHIVLIEGNIPSTAGVLDTPLNPLKPNLSHRLITNGQWSVLSSQVWVDNESNLVYFMGNFSSVLESHLYVASLEGPCKDPVQLTPSGLYHSSISVNTKLKVFVASCSNLTTPPSVAVFTINSSSVSATRVFNIHDSKQLPGSFTAPTSFTLSAVTASASLGETLHGIVYPPVNMEEGKKYPTVVYVYGGPSVQLVKNEFSPSIMKLAQWTNSGYAAVVLDNRGSANRGSKFESYIQGAMGSVEIDDQANGLHAAARTVNYIDLERVGICGWSYGGYMSLLALAKIPSVFKVAIAGAPVTDWLWYDTGYTERYLGVPTDDDTSAYDRSSVIPLAKNFPNETGRLLIIHGMSDENVFFTHTSLLVDALVRHCKPYQLQVYNGERHGLRSSTARNHCDATVLAFLQANL